MTAPIVQCGCHPGVLWPAEQLGRDCPISVAEADLAALRERVAVAERERDEARDRLADELNSRTMREAEFKAAYGRLFNSEAAMTGKLEDAEARLAALEQENERLRGALHRIAWEPMGDAEASAVTVLSLCVDEAKAALAASAPKGETGAAGATELVERCACGKHVLERWCGTYADADTHRREKCVRDDGSEINPPKRRRRFVYYGHGASGDYNTLAEAVRACDFHAGGAVYVRIDDPATWGSAPAESARPGCASDGEDEGLRISAEAESAIQRDALRSKNAEPKP